MTKWAKGVYLGTAITLEHYPLIVKGFLPFLLPRPGHGTNVFGEIFQVPKRGILDVLDELEGHPHWYMRSRISVCSNGSPCSAWAYFLNDRLIPQDWRSKQMLSNFSVYGSPPKKK